MALGDYMSNMRGGRGAFLATQAHEQEMQKSQLGQLLAIANMVEMQKQRAMQQQLMQANIRQKDAELSHQGDMMSVFKNAMGGAAPSAPAGALPTGTEPTLTAPQAAPGVPGQAQGRLNMAPIALAMSGMKGAPTAAQMLMKMTDPGDVEWVKSGDQQLPRFKSSGQPVPWLQPLPIGMNAYETARITLDKAAEARQQGRAYFETGMQQPGVPGTAAPAPSATTSPDGKQVFIAPDNAVAEAMAKSLQASGMRNYEVTTPGRTASGPGSAPAPGLTPKGAADAREAAVRTSDADFIKEEFRPSQQQAQAAKTMNMQIEAFRSLPLSKKTGWGTEAKVYAARILEGLGIAPQQAKEFAADAQMFNSIAFQQNWTLLQAQKGPQTEGDAQRAQKVFAQLANTPEANEFIWDFAKAVNDQAIKKAEFYRRNYSQAVNSGGLLQLETRWGEESTKSIWDAPSMKKWQGRSDAAVDPRAASGKIREGGPPAVGGVPGGIKFLGFE